MTNHHAVMPDRLATRADPDVLLRRIQAGEAKANRGRLKVFFGAWPGVGKTFAMLEAAQRARGNGVDVVVGVLETHGRAETHALLTGLEALSQQVLEYRGRALQEFDLDALLRRHPALVLIDELAHTNAPGARHPKRWQDVVEVLAAGIDVWTTLNVQHLESVNDVVAQVTGVRVRETLPDRVLEQADEVELVDVPPEALLARLQEGKVYAPEQATRAAGSFFRRGNLLALRELALRRLAERVDADVQAHRRDEGIQATWPVAEHILVCVGPTRTSADLIRAARRMAAGLRARWTAVAVDTPEHTLPEADRARLNENLRLAEQLGAQVVTLSGLRVSDELLAWARVHNATRIILGKPTHPRWRDLVFGSLLDEVVRGSGDIEVHAIAGQPGEERTSAGPPPTGTREPPRHYAYAALAVVATTGLTWLLQHFAGATELVMVYLLAIVVSAARFGRGPSVLASALSVAAFDFFFIPPYYTFAVADVGHLLTFAMLFVVGVVISGLTDRVRAQARQARAREERTAALFALSRDLSKARTAEEILDAARAHIGGLFEANLLAFVAAGRSDALVAVPAAGLDASEHDRSVAEWVFAHGEPAGLTTETLAAARALFLPLTGLQPQGVLGVVPRSPRSLEDPTQRQLLETLCRQVGAALERVRSAEDAHAARLHAERQELRNSLLSSVSHDLRTPLAAITGSATTLLNDGAAVAPDAQRELLETVRDEAERLNRLVGNLLDMTRLESGGLHVHKEWTPLEEVVGAALDRAGHVLHDHEVRLSLPADLPLVPLDGVLIEQVLLNLLDNAAKYTAAGTPIDIAARAEPGRVVVEVADRGPGLPEGSELRVFEKFFRASPLTGARGTGLGLAIVHGIVTAHGGTVAAGQREGGGAVFRFTLPVEGAPSAPPEEP